MKGYLDMKAKGTLASKRCVQECHEWFPFTVDIVKEVLNIKWIYIHVLPNIMVINYMDQNEKLAAYGVACPCLW